MAKKRSGAGNIEVKADLTSMMDVCFQLIAFFVMMMVIAKDEMAQRVTLPTAMMAPVLDDDQIPDSLNINIDKRGYCLQWGLEINLNEPGGMALFTQRIKNEASLQKERQRQQGIDWKKDGLSTTIIMRVDEDVDYTLFRQVMDTCRNNGFRKFQMKARKKEDTVRG